MAAALILGTLCRLREGGLAGKSRGRHGTRLGMWNNDGTSNTVQAEKLWYRWTVLNLNTAEESRCRPID
ncbi:hypothetical protein ElyMa_005998900 [Elysia marginata]|uniref:Secreted protein n=1 Tax=Elysia marginata TaxID=1093978 RepID=A0AAV4GGZ6_9GAST|nr:hypothetical protein ElyMa_005998900 [Elysia marginata]